MALNDSVTRYIYKRYVYRKQNPSDGYGYALTTRDGYGYALTIRDGYGYELTITVALNKR